MRIHHIALESDWRQALRDGSYTTSTVGKSLADEGFIHAARPDQLAGVSRRYYTGVKGQLVDLEIETDKLTSPWREDEVGGTTYPHIYGPLNVDAVTAVQPWHSSGRHMGMLEVIMSEVLFRMFLAILVMLLGAFGAYIGSNYGETAKFVGALVGLAIGIGVMALTLRRRGRRQTT